MKNPLPISILNKLSWLRSGALVVIGLAAFSPPVQANLLKNGSFEEGSFNGSIGRQELAVGATTVTGWKVVNIGVEWVSNTNPFYVPTTAFDGNLYLNLAGANSSPVFGGVTQTVATTVGTNYAITFYIGFVPDNFAYVGPSSVIVQAGTQSQTFTVGHTDTPADSKGWRKFTYLFTAISTSTPITITGILGEGDQGGFIGLDDVSIDETATAPSAPPNLITNGDFEDIRPFTDMGGSEMRLPTGSTALPGWTTSIGYINWTGNENANSITAQSGSFSIDLTGYTDNPTYGAISQTVPTTVGKSYTIAFYLGDVPSSAPFAGPVSALLTVGSATKSFTTPASGTGTTVWTKCSYTFTATAATTKISIAGTASKGGQYIGLDNVSMAAAAAPPDGVLVNGSFDDKTTFKNDGKGNMKLLPGSTAMNGWKTVGAEITWEANTSTFGFKSQSSVYSLDLTGFHDAAPYGGITQTVATTVGKSYDLGFYLGMLPNKAPYNGPVAVIVRIGNHQKTFTYEKNGDSTEATSWTNFVYTFVAESTSTAITITGKTATGGAYLGLDTVTLVPTPAPGNLLNGSFELGKFAINDGYNSMSIPVGSTVIDGWTVVNGSVTWAGIDNPFHAVAQLGHLSLDLTGDLDTKPYGGVSQIVKTKVGTSYQLSFYLGAVPFNASEGGPVSVTVTAGNQSGIATFTPDSSGDGTTTLYGKYNFVFTPEDVATPISIVGRSTAGGSYIALDNVTLKTILLQTVTFTPVVTGLKAGQAVTLKAAASSGLPVTYSVVSGPATVTGSKVTFTNAGTVVLAASQAGNATYAYGSASQTVTVAKGAGNAQQLITFPVIADKTFGDAPFDFVAPTSTSGLPVAVTVTSGPAKVSGNTLTIIGGGRVTLAGIQKGNAVFRATEVDMVFDVNPANQTIKFLSIAAVKVGQTVTLGATASSKLAVTYTAPAGTVKFVGTKVTFLKAGNIKITASQFGNASYNATQASITVTVNAK